MANNGRIFISHSHDDNARCAPLLTALDAWDVDYIFDTGDLAAGQPLPDGTLRELGARDILLRVCTGATPRSPAMNLEVTTFRGLQADDQRQGHGDRRALINLILDADYQRGPFEAATLFIDAVSRPRAVWLGDLARAIGVRGRPRRRLSRRAILGYGAAAVVALGSVGAAGAVYADYHPVNAEAALTPHTPGALLWRLPGVSTHKDIPASSTIAGNTLYTMSGFELIAWDLAQMTSAGPAKLWTRKFEAQDAFSSVTASGDTLYVSVDFSLYALKASDGSQQWRGTATGDGSLFAGPATGDGAIFSVDETGELFAFRASDGAVLWHAQAAKPAAFLYLVSNPVSDGASVYIGSIDHHVYCYNASDGSVRWKTLTRGKVVSTPALVDGVVYVGSTDNYVYALNAHDGSVKWKYRTGDAVNSWPAVVDGVVYVASDDSYLYALDANSGKAYWRTVIGDVSGGSQSASNTGTVTSGLAVTGDGVCLLDSQNGIVRCYTRSTGAPRWKYVSKDPSANAPPVGAHGVMYFGSGDDALYAFGA